MEKFSGGLLNCTIVSQLVLDDICSKPWAAALAWSGCHFVMDKIRCVAPGRAPRNRSTQEQPFPLKWVVKHH